MHTRVRTSLEYSQVYKKRTKEVSISPLFFTCPILCMPCIVSFVNCVIRDALCKSASATQKRTGRAATPVD